MDADVDIEVRRCDVVTTTGGAVAEALCVLYEWNEETQFDNERESLVETDSQPLMCETVIAAEDIEVEPQTVSAVDAAEERPQAASVVDAAEDIEVRPQTASTVDAAQDIEWRSQTGNKVDGHAVGHSELSQKTRKKAVRTSVWKRHVRKLARQSGQEYVSSSGQRVPGKTPCVEESLCTCRLRCDEKFNFTQRTNIFNEFYEMDENGKFIA